MRTLIVLTIVLLFGGFSAPSLASNVSDDMKALGANKKLLRKARAVHAKNRIRIVQKRAVDRDLRLEAYTGFGIVSGGDPYVDSNSLGVNIDLHINPKFSIGGRFAHYNNELSSEGERIFNKTSIDNPFRSTYDYASTSLMGTMTWYPMYGKFNLFNLRVVQFDIYTLAGAGQIKLANSGDQPIWTVGGGMGLWLSKHVSTRFEIGYQTYEDTIGEARFNNEEQRQIEQTIFSFNLGVLL